MATLAAACTARPPEPPIAVQLDLAATALSEGRFEEASELIARTRQRDGQHIDAAQWSAVLAELTWRDDDAVREQTIAIRNARARAPDPAADAERSGRLGDLLFQSGRWGESIGPLVAGAVGADAQRRGAFADIAAMLPFVRKPSGPLLTEQPLLPGDAPEFVCGTGERQRPFAIDTGTSLTTLSRSFAEEVEVLHRRAAGTALDGAGRSLPIEIGLMQQFSVGEIDIGAVPVLVIDDAALRLRDLHGGPERVPRGVLGLDLIGACRLTLDPERQSVVLELPRGLPVEQSVQCMRVEGRCLVPVFVEGVRLWFVLDTGASHSSLSEAGIARLPGGDARAVPSYRRVRTVGGGILSVREVRDLVLRCSEARFLGVTLPVVARGESHLFPVHGVLGIDLLSRCRVILDRGRARLIPLP